MLHETDMATYACGVAAALRVIGRTPRADVLGMLHALHLSEDESAAVLAFALLRRILDANGEALSARSALEH